MQNGKESAAIMRKMVEPCEEEVQIYIKTFKLDREKDETAMKFLSFIYTAGAVGFADTGTHGMVMDAIFAICGIEAELGTAFDIVEPINKAIKDSGKFSAVTKAIKNGMGPMLSSFKDTLMKAFDNMEKEVAENGEDRPLLKVVQVEGGSETTH